MGHIFELHICQLMDVLVISTFGLLPVKTCMNTHIEGIFIVDICFHFS